MITPEATMAKKSHPVMISYNDRWKTIVASG